MRFHRNCGPFAQNEQAPDPNSFPPFGPFGRRRRLFDQGDLRFILLKLISQNPSHGYELIKAIEERLAGAYSPSPGIVYPTLTLLEEMGLVRVHETDGSRKLYAITPEGEAALNKKRAMVDAIFERMDEISARHAAGPAPQIIRAMENLRTALRLRLSRGPLGADQVAAIASLLDDAAKTVEAS